MSRATHITVHALDAGASIKGEPGTLAQWPTGDSMIWCPKCGRGATLATHTITKNPDATLTLTPSLVCPFTGCGAHYYVRENKIQWL